jgi:predicted small lipoprotein YifL
MKKPALWIAALAGALLLAACGLKGGLETPPPVWGEAREKYEADLKAKAAAAEAAEKAKKEQEAQQAAPTK